MNPKDVIEQSLNALPGRLGVALSGGSDSTGLLVLAAQYCRDQGRDLHAATVDHGLRPEARAEANAAGALCASLNIPHRILPVTSLNEGGDLQARARVARYAALHDWAEAAQIDWVLLGHTHDDAAETFLMRLARGSGVDGLSGMPRQRRSGTVGWARPALDLQRAELRRVLQDQSICWSDDPSNEDPRFARVQIRQALPDLAALGLTADTLVQTAQRMQDAQDVLEQAAINFEQTSLRVEHGDVCLNGQTFLALPQDTLGRVFSHALQWVSGAVYRPRYAALQGAIAALRLGRAHTLHGCLIYSSKGDVRITREARLCAETLNRSELWDGRWDITGPFEPGDQIGCLGEAGLRSIGGKTQSAAVPYRSLLSSPAVRRANTVVAAPLAGFGAGWSAHVKKDWRGA